MKRFPRYSFTELMNEDSRFFRYVDICDYAHAAQYDQEAVDGV